MPKQTNQYPKLLRDAGGYHERARDEQQVSELVARGFRVVSDPVLDGDGNLAGWQEPANPYADAESAA